MDVTAQLSDESRAPITVPFEPGESLNEATERYGEEVVFTRYKSAVIIDLQAFMRGLMKATDENGNPKWTDEQISQKCAEWKPGVKKAPKSKLEKAEDLVEDLDAEQIEALLAKLKAAKKK